MFFETSAKNGTNLDEAVAALSRSILQNIQRGVVVHPGPRLLFDATMADQVDEKGNLVSRSVGLA